MSAARTPALFLDRDGVINVDHGYVSRIDDFEWIDGVFETVHLAKKLGFATIIVTNQAGIARGYYTEENFNRLTRWMLDHFVAAGAPIDDVYFCPFHPDGIPPYNIDSPDRKPAPGMLLKAAQRHSLDLSRSILIGDRETDIAAGRAVGVWKTALFSLTRSIGTQADIVIASHAEACDWIRRVAATNCGDA